MHVQCALHTAPCSKARACVATARLTSRPGSCKSRTSQQAFTHSSHTPATAAAAAAAPQQQQRAWQLRHYAGHPGRAVATCVSRVGVDVCTTSPQTSSNEGTLLGPQHFHAGGSHFCVRQYEAGDHNDVLLLQAGSFYEAAPLGILDSLAFSLFRAEVLDGLKQKVKGLSPDSFAMMVVQRHPDHEDSSSSGSSPNGTSSSSGASMSSRQAHEALIPHRSSSSSSGDGGGNDASSTDSDSEASSSGSSRSLEAASSNPLAGSVVGVIEVAVQASSEIARHLQGDDSSHAYISSMAVLPTLRRKGIARAMLAAAEQQARLWQVPYLALHVYVSNPAACRLYESCGFQVLHTDPGWKAVFGGKVRLLMVKPL